MASEPSDPDLESGEAEESGGEGDKVSMLIPSWPDLGSISAPNLGSKAHSNMKLCNIQTFLRKELKLCTCKQFQFLINTN